MVFQIGSVHPVRIVMLIAYAQFRSFAPGWWAQFFGDGLLPRFEFTMNWCARRAAPVVVPTGTRLELIWDLSTAQTILAQAGLALTQETLATFDGDSTPGCARCCCLCIHKARVMDATGRRGVHVDHVIQKLRCSTLHFLSLRSRCMPVAPFLNLPIALMRTAWRLSAALLKIRWSLDSSS
jgi:hypothetical protein